MLIGAYLAMLLSTDDTKALNIGKKNGGAKKSFNSLNFFTNKALKALKGDIIINIHEHSPAQQANN